MPGVAPTYISIVIRLFECPAILDTSVASSFQANSAVVQKTCGSECQVHLPLASASRQSAA